MSANNLSEKRLYSKDDFSSGQDVRWCPGCGDYSILATMQRTLAKFDIPRERYVFISGIGCSSRFPYYMNTFGFHTIHGRAPTIATGLRCVNPDLAIWVVTGDGDGLGPGLGHLVHCMRRNLNINIVFVNNQIYGLTKGQYSPTSEVGKVTKSSPAGSIEYPVSALRIAIASEATFIARTSDTAPAHMGYVFERAMRHKGVSFIEIYQNCIIFNDRAFGLITGRDTRDDHMVNINQGQPLVFGKEQNRGIRLKDMQPEVVEFEPGHPPSDLVIHDEQCASSHYAYMLAQMTYPQLPMVFGVLRAIQRPAYDEMMEQQAQDAIKKKGTGGLQELLYGAETWTVS